MNDTLDIDITWYHIHLQNNQDSYMFPFFIGVCISLCLDLLQKKITSPKKTRAPSLKKLIWFPTGSKPCYKHQWLHYDQRRRGFLFPQLKTFQPHQRHVTKGMGKTNVFGLQVATPPETNMDTDTQNYGLEKGGSF